MKTENNSITITLRLSESLLSILKDAGNPKTEIRRHQADKGATIRDVLVREGISPLLVPMITINNVRTPAGTVLESDTTVTLIGPLAGG